MWENSGMSYQSSSSDHSEVSHRKSPNLAQDDTCSTQETRKATLLSFKKRKSNFTKSQIQRCYDVWRSLNWIKFNPNPSLLQDVSPRFSF